MQEKLINGIELKPPARALAERLVNVFQTGGVHGDYGVSPISLKSPRPIT